MFHPAESSEQQVDTYEMLVKSPTYNIEDKTQKRFDKEFYKDVRYPSTLQSRPPSVASSVFPTERANQRCAVSAHARRRPATLCSAAFYYCCRLRSVVCQPAQDLHPAPHQAEVLVDQKQAEKMILRGHGDSTNSITAEELQD